MQFISDPSLPGHGDITGLFFNRDKSVVAVVSAFRSLTNPPARASYGGQRLCFRVALYHPRNVKPFAVIDSLHYRVNDVAFHPFEPTLTIATGWEDGGIFEGELVVWDWESGQDSKRIGRIPEVARSTFSKDGSSIIAFVRPWDEDSVEDLGDPFDIFYEVHIPYSAAIFDGDVAENRIAVQLLEKVPNSASDIEFDPRFPSHVVDLETTLQKEFGFKDFESRSPIWDVAWLGSDGLAIVHDSCQLEIFGSDEFRRHVFAGLGHGVQILKGQKPIVHAVYQDKAAKSWPSSFSSQLLRYEGSTRALFCR